MGSRRRGRSLEGEVVEVAEVGHDGAKACLVVWRRRR